MRITISDIASILESQQLLSSSILPREQEEIENLLTDSRNLHRPENTIFFAINTPGGNDGHKFILPLYQKGVKNFIVEETPAELQGKEDANILIVKDVIAALAKIGAIGRKNAEHIVAITGSYGKTSLKELLFQLLEPLKKVSRSPRSYNSKIGVPLSMWSIREESDIAIIEAGISRVGEMTHLTDIINPETVIFTNISSPHSEGFDSLKAKAIEKSLLAFGDATKSVIFNKDDIYLKEALQRLPQRVRKFTCSFADESSYVFINKVSYEESSRIRVNYIFKGNQYHVSFHGDRAYEVENAALALTYLLSQEFSPEIISERFKNIYKTGTRLNVTDGINGTSLILDSYTADISSLLPAIDFMRRRKTPYQTMTLIMSDVMHSTESEEESYKKIAEIISYAGIEKFIGIGEKFFNYKELFKNGSHIYKTTEEFLTHTSAGDFFDEVILLKGTSQWEFKEILRLLESKNHETVLEVNLDSLVANYNYFRSKLPSETGIVAMVKASGYGAGSYEIAKTLQDCGAAYLAVAVLDEGIELRRQGIIMPIMVMNPKTANYKAMFANRLEPEIYSLSMLRDLIIEAERNGIKKYPIHIKLDTGMHRMGFIEEELPKIVELLTSTDCVRASTVFSHLATSDCPDMDDYTKLQLSRFENMTSKLSAHLPYSFKRHILNSAGILRFPTYHYELARLGIGLYGANTLPPEFEKPLAQVSTLRTIIINIREWEAGETIGYGRKGVLKKRSRIATIPIGYADGLDRHFGNGNITVNINGSDAPTIGNICMDATMIDVTGIDCKEGDSVEIFGEKTSLQRLADALGTIPYEILTSVSPRVKRIYYRE